MSRFAIMTGKDVGKTTTLAARNIIACCPKLAEYLKSMSKAKENLAEAYIGGPPPLPSAALVVVR